MATDTVTAIHKKIRNTMRKPPNRFPTFSFFTLTAHGARATSGALRDLTSPFTCAPSRVVMRPSSATTSPPTRPVMTDVAVHDEDVAGDLPANDEIGRRPRTRRR